MTYIDLVKAVLRRLRDEDGISNVSDTGYTTLIGDYVNETKREVEDSWNWVQLRTTISITTVSGTYNYTLTNSRDRFKILQVINNTQDSTLRKASYKDMNHLLTLNSQSNGEPTYYNINGQSSGDATVDLYPVPNAADTIDFHMVVPQAELTSNTTELVVPDYPVLLGAYAKAISERGDEGGVKFNDIYDSYQKALSDAIGIDAMNTTDEMIWMVE